MLIKAASGMFLSVVLILFTHAAAAEPNEHFIVRDSNKPIEEVAARIERFATENEDWIFLSSFGLKGGEITAVKICYLPIGKDIFAAGMHVAAMMPCGHMALYEEDGRTHLAVLHPKFMTTLNPDPNLERAVAKATPAFERMLREIGL